MTIIIKIHIIVENSSEGESDNVLYVIKFRKVLRSGGYLGTRYQIYANVQYISQQGILGKIICNHSSLQNI